MRFLLRLLWVGLVIVIVGLLALRHFNTSQQAVLSNTTMAATQVKPTYALDESALNTAIQTAITANPALNLSVSVTDLQTGKRYHYGEIEAYTAASIAKLFTATLFLHEVETGQTNLSQQISGLPAQTQLEKLIVDSDNAAWHALNKVLTRQKLEEYVAAMGLTSYKATANTVNSDDINLLLTRLAGGQLLNNTNTQLLLSYMERAGMRNYILAGVPAGATAYHKTGYLSDRFHDAAIIKKGDRSFVLVIFSKVGGSYDFAKGAAVFSGLSAAVSGIFFGNT